MSGSSQSLWETFTPLVFASLAFIFFAILAVVMASKRREQTKRDYLAALDRYRGNPTDQKLRQSALEAGRHYAVNTANGYGTAAFDEAGIRNDLDAIVMAAPLKPEPTKPAIETRLQTLESLMNQGIITEIEYHDRRSMILDEI